MAASRLTLAVQHRRVGRFACEAGGWLSEGELQSLVDSIAAREDSHVGPHAQRPLGGRTATWLHDLPSVGPVLIKAYRRGGMLRHLRGRHYLRLGPTRPAREFRAMRMARAVGVNVPEPVACFSRGWLFYRGWLATRHIEGRSLASLKSADEGTLALAVEEMIRQVRVLVRNRIAHVDLHPGNVILDGAGRLYLLDFDKASVFTGPLQDLRDQYHARWKRAVEKHGLPWALAEQFRERLREPASSLPSTSARDRRRGPGDR